MRPEPAGVEASGPKEPPACGSDRLGVQSVTRRPHGSYDVDFTFRVHGSAQAADMHVDRARLDVDVAAPDRVQHFLAREDPAGMLHEKLQQAELGRPEMNRPSVALHAVRGEVHRHVVESQLALRRNGVRSDAAARAFAPAAQSMLNGLVM